MDFHSFQDTPLDGAIVTTAADDNGKTWTIIDTVGGDRLVVTPNGFHVDAVANYDTTGYYTRQFIEAVNVRAGAEVPDVTIPEGAIQ